MPGSNERISILEAHIAHQDRAYDELSDVVARQDARIALLEQKFEALTVRYRSLRDSVDGIDPVDRPPPHY